MQTKINFICLWLILVTGCRQPYEPAVIKANNNFLVVEGVINASAGGVTTITLSRTINVTDSSFASNPELRAQVRLQSKSGTGFLLREQTNGIYKSEPLTLSSNEQYRIQITAAGSQYASDFVSVNQTPAIDSLTWEKRPEGVVIFLNTHDAANNTHYYRWDYTETWEYHSLLETPYGVRNGAIFIRDTTNSIHVCWQTAASSSVLLGSSVNLSQDVISHDSIALVPQDDEKLGVRYSILTRQYAVSKEAFAYWQLLQKATQQLGSIFDAQPSQLKGNLYNVNNPLEPVIGYIGASTVTEKRLFIYNSDIAGWKNSFPGLDCQVLDIAGSFSSYTFPDTSYIPYYFTSSSSLKIAKKFCLDCTLKGGTNVKPSFW